MYNKKYLILFTVLLLVSSVAAATGTVTVSVEDTNGNSVSRADVILYQNDYNRVGDAWTGEQGNVTFNVESSASESISYRATATKQCYTTDAGEATIDYNTDSETINLQINSYEPQGQLTVNVFNDGSSLRGATVSLNGPEDRQRTTGSSGSADFTGLPYGSYDVEAQVESESGTVTQTRSFNVDLCGPQEGDWTEGEKTFNFDVEQVIEDDDEAEELDARFSYSPSNPDVDEEVEFDASNSEGDIEEYRWDFDDGDEATGREVEHSFDEEGDYNVELTVESETGSATKTRTVEVGEEEEPDDLSVSLTSPSDGEDIELPETFEWNVDSGVENTIFIGEDRSDESTLEDDYTIRENVGEDQEYTVEDGDLEEGEDYIWGVRVEYDNDENFSNVRDFTIEETVEPGQCKLDVGSLDLDPYAIADGESSTASITVENMGDSTQDFEVEIYTGDQTYFEDSFSLDGDESETIETSVSVDEDSLVFAKVTTDGSPCGDKSYTRSEELLFLGDPLGQADLTVDVEDMDGDSIDDAKVVVDDGSRRLDYTEPNGKTSFRIRPGSYDVTVSKRGYETEEQSITLEDGDDTSLDFELEQDGDRDEDEAELTVHVEDDDNDELEDARVTVENGDDEVEYTDDDGDAEFSLEADGYDIVAECNGEEETEDIELEEGDEETIDIDFNEEFDDDRCEEGEDRDDSDDEFNEDGLNIKWVNYPDNVCRGSSFLAEVRIENNGGFHEVVTLTGSGLGSISIGNSFSLEEDEEVTRNLRFTNVQGDGEEEFKIVATNHESDSVTREIEVGGSDCGGTASGRATGVTMDLGKQEVVEGETVMVKGYVDGVRGRTEVTINVDGRTAARVSTQPDGYYQAFIRADSPGDMTVTATSNGQSSFRQLQVMPTSTVSSVEAPEKVVEGERFTVCADIESRATPKVYLTKDSRVLETKTAKGEVCFLRTASGTGEHKFEAKSLTRGRESAGSTTVEILEAGSEVENFPDQVASVESESGMVKVELYNTEERSKTYNLELIGLQSEWVDKSEKEVTLTQGERRTVYFYITPRNEGHFNPILQVESDGDEVYSQDISLEIGGTKKPASRGFFSSILGLFNL